MTSYFFPHFIYKHFRLGADDRVVHGRKTCTRRLRDRKGSLRLSGLSQVHIFWPPGTKSRISWLLHRTPAKSRKQNVPKISTRLSRSQKEKIFKCLLWYGHVEIPIQKKKITSMRALLNLTHVEIVYSFFYRGEWKSAKWVRILNF